MRRNNGQRNEWRPNQRQPSDLDPVQRLVLRQDAVRLGYTDVELLRLRRAGRLTGIARGAYLVGDVDTDERALHRARIEACRSRIQLDGVLSHQSAAIMHGLDLWSTPLRQVHLTRSPPARGHRSVELQCHVAVMDTADIVEVDGLSVTSVARTVVDLARRLCFEAAVVTADSALRLRLLKPGHLTVGAQAIAGSPGARNAAHVAAFADGRSESVGESRSRVLIEAVGLPAPELQHEIRDGSGRLVGRSDFWFEDEQTVGEFDGRGKYGRLLKPGQRPEDAVYAEKLREDDIRGVGAGVARWTWADLDRPRVVRAKLMRAFELTRRR